MKLLPTSLRVLPGDLGEPRTAGLAHSLPAPRPSGAAELRVLLPLRSRAPSPGSLSSGPGTVKEDPAALERKIN